MYIFLTKEINNHCVCLKTPWRTKRIANVFEVKWKNMFYVSRFRQIYLFSLSSQGNNHVVFNNYNEWMFGCGVFGWVVLMCVMIGRVEEEECRVYVNSE